MRKRRKKLKKSKVRLFAYFEEDEEEVRGNLDEPQKPVFTESQMENYNQIPSGMFEFWEEIRP